MTKNIAVVGGGPKAVAIAAKADVLNRVKRTDIRVTVFERSEIGANWTGNHGYTDGEARLCTLAERDLGFPYDAGLHDKHVATAMYSDYSWGAYLVDAPRTGGREGFSGWVNHGRAPPSHGDFGRYLRWAFERSQAKLEFGEVTALERSESGWGVRYATATGSRTGGPFDGVVVTGPGPAHSRVSHPVESDRIVDGVSFWKNATGFLSLGGSAEDAIVIIGAGGTAAAVAARLAREEKKRTLFILGKQAVLFTRADTFFESQIFSDDEIWERLDLNVRSEFTRRLNRGVVWASVSDELSKCGNLRYEPGEARSISVTGDPQRIVVEYENNLGRQQIEASLVVDASGFDGWWFLRLLPDDLRAAATDSREKTQKTKREALIAAMGEHFSLFETEPGPIHAPTLSQAVGPGFSTLMVLGAMSDRILDRYK